MSTVFLAVSAGFLVLVVGGIAKLAYDGWREGGGNMTRLFFALKTVIELLVPVFVVLPMMLFRPRRHH